MADNGLEIAEKLQSSAKFFPVGDPHRKMLVSGSTTIKKLLETSPPETPLDVVEAEYTADGVDAWLRERGVNLTSRMRRILAASAKLGV
tara:strand:- start:343 stop:609 length:267 start_codon:yes stop_codon:yes gene_type:complete